MVGQISDTARWNLVRVLLALVEKDAGRLTTSMVQLCGASQNADYSGLQASLGRLVEPYAGRPLAEVPIVPVLAELAGLLRAHRLRLPRETALMMKMLVMADGLGKQLDPGFELTAQLAPFARQVILGSLTPEAPAARLKKLGWEALRFGTEAPELARRLLDVLERGGLDVHFRADELDQLRQDTGARGELVHWTAALSQAGSGRGLGH